MATEVFRFALGSPAAPFSGLWRAWTHEDEVHLAVRATHEDVALTIYPTGRWRIAVGESLSRWTRPKEFRPGWTRGPDLVIPHAATPLPAPPADRYAAEPLAWLPPPTAGFQARFSLLIATPSAEASHWRPLDVPGTQSLAVLPLRTAGAFHLYRVDEPAASDYGAGPPGFTVIVCANQMGCPPSGNRTNCNGVGAPGS